MLTDIEQIESIQLEVSPDFKVYQLHKELNRKDFQLAFSPVPSTMEFIKALMEAGRNICLDGKYKSFRLKICFGEENFYMFDASQKNYSPVEVYRSIDPEKLRYKALTKREMEILCFHYRGYEPDQIAFVFGININDVKRNCKNIYKKAGFKDAEEMKSWCKKYLDEVIEKNRKVFEMSLA